MLSQARKKPQPQKKCEDHDMESDESTDDKISGRMGVWWLYVFFLSARHLHFPAAVGLVVTSSVGLLMLSIISCTSYTAAVFLPLLALVCLEISWFCFFRPEVVVSAQSRTNSFQPVARYPSFPTGSPKKRKIFRNGNGISVILPAVYVAHTGYFDKHGLPINGLYARTNISKG